MKRIRLNKLIAIPLYGYVFTVIDQNGQSFSSKQFPSLSSSFLIERINVFNTNTTIIIANEVSTTIQMPK